jgi:Tol biopolymer transport system component
MARINLKSPLIAAVWLALPLIPSRTHLTQKKGETFKIQRLTQGIGLHRLGPISPDRKYALVLAQRPGQGQNLHLMDLSDFSIKRLTNFTLGVSDAAWSPDGQMIAFAGYAETGSFSEIYILNLATNQMRQMTRNSFNDREPVFAPDGQRLFYTTDESPLPDAAFGIPHVAWVPVKGGAPTAFTEDEGPSIQPGISPSNDGILLIKVDEASGRHSLWQYSFSGKPERNLTGRKLARIHRYIVSRAAKQIVLWAQEEPEQQEDIYTLDLTSGELKPIGEPDLQKREPTVSPDGRLIAFIGAAERGLQLFVFDSASGQIQQLTYKPARTISPTFISSGKILFGSDRDAPRDQDALPDVYLIDLESPAKR